MNTKNQKTIFITGSSTGLGKATAKLFASNGWKVIATMRNPEKETELGKPDNVTLLSLDVSDPQQIKSVVEKVVAMGEVDVVFNNAGYGLAGPLGRTLRCADHANGQYQFDGDHSHYPGFRATLQGERGKGLFINTTSIGGLISVPFNSIYHATKWALEGWSESMAFELKRFGIGIKTLSPGGMKTDFFTRSFDTGKHEAYDQFVEKVYDSNYRSRINGYLFNPRSDRRNRI